jgi:hypothetical protein
MHKHVPRTGFAPKPPKEVFIQAHRPLTLSYAGCIPPYDVYKIAPDKIVRGFYLLRPSWFRGIRTGS